MYGFRKVSHIEHGIKDENDDLEFQHMYFRRGQEHLLDKIKRKIAGGTPHIKTEPLQEVQSEDISKVITEVQVMKEKQETVNTKLQSMKRENELLWREVASLRQKHSKQQQIVNKLIQFLIHLVRGRSGLGMNLHRKRPLMLSDSNQVSVPPAKMKKYVKTSELPMYSVQSPEGSQGVDGPVISELPDQDVFTENKPVNTTTTFNGAQSQAISAATALPKSPAEPISSKLDLSTNEWKLPSDLLASDILDMQEFKDLKDLPIDLNTPSPSIFPPFSDDHVLDPSYIPAFSPISPAPNNSQDKNSTSLQQKVRNTPSFSRQQSLHELNEHVDSLQYDLDGLRDILSSNQYSIDPSFLLGLFKQDSTSQPDNVINIMDPDNVKAEDDNDPNNLNTSGSQLVQYKPSEDLPDLFDLANLSKEDEEALQNTVDVGDLNYFTKQDVPADDLD